MKAPEKIYIHPDIGGRKFIKPWLIRRASKESVEYTRTDAFIKKACEWLRDNYLKYPNEDCTDTTKFVMDFKKYIEGE